MGGVRVTWVIAVVMVGCGPSVEPSGGSDDDGGACVDAAPMCPPVAGDCYGDSPAPECENGEWVCPRAGLVAPSAACSEDEGEVGEAESEAGTDGGSTHEDDGPVPHCDPDDPAPPECFDQGPGECADATEPATCDGTAWSCPSGSALDGYGEGCEWPSPEGGSIESGSSGDDGTSSGSTTGGDVDDATGTA